MSNKWQKLFCSEKELQLIGTLNGGQSFRWKMIKREDKDSWLGVFSSRVWILQQHKNHILYQVFEKVENEPESKKIKVSYDEMLRDYFQLNLNLVKNYAKWSESDPNFKLISQQFYGIRILKQDPVENIFSFICSSNNNISRITSMVEKIALFYGEKICNIGEEAYYAFPSVDKLAQDGVEQKLKANGFGYRAKYIAKSAEIIVQKGGENWLNALKTLEYEAAKKQLMTLTGVGPKVADCICLMSLGHLNAIPVDTHVYQIAVRDYLPKLAKQKTVTEKIYKEIGDHFRMMYGPLAGWAHTVLFCADLKKFKQEKKPNPKGR